MCTTYIDAHKNIEQQPLSSECHDEQNQLSFDSGTTKFWAHGVRANGIISAYKSVQEIFEGDTLLWHLCTLVGNFAMHTRAILLRCELGIDRQVTLWRPRNWEDIYPVILWMKIIFSLLMNSGSMGSCASLTAPYCSAQHFFLLSFASAVF